MRDGFRPVQPQRMEPPEVPNGLHAPLRRLKLLL